VTILYLVDKSSFSLSLESSEQFTNLDCRMLETYDHVLTELILQGEVSETTSEPRLELSATDLGIFHGAMIEKPTTRPLVEKLKITNNDYPGKMALRANRNAN
jgi:hypothetical protein